MRLFGQLVRTVVNVAVLPVKLVQDVVMAPLDVTLATDTRVGGRTVAHLEKLKDEASE